jgi:RND family efflux transporter MFP subunit
MFSLNRRLMMASLIGVAFATPGALAQQGGGEGPPPAPVVVTTVERAVMAPKLDVPGTVLSKGDAKVAAEVTGRVIWVAEVGTALKVGEPIARLDDSLMKMQLAEDEARIKRLEANFKYQGQDVTRLKRLSKTGNTPQSRLELATAQRDMTEQELAQARVMRERTLYNLKRSQIVAPFDGRVVSRLIQVGEFSSIGGAVARFVDTSQIEVKAQPPLASAHFLKEGMKLSVIHGDKVVEGEIRAVVPVGDEVSRTLEIRVTVPSNGWIIGSAVKVSVPTAEPHEVIAAHRDTLVLRAGGHSVFKLGKEDAVVRVSVERGLEEGELVEIKGDVQPGDRLVVRGAESLEDGQKVAINTPS